MRKLFLDDGDIARKRNVRCIIHPGKKRPDGPVLVREAPWEEAVICGGTVHRENEGYRMWYQSYGRGTYLNLYAVSRDGIVWERPGLDQYEDFDGHRENNIFLSRLALRSNHRAPVSVNQDHNPNVLYTPHQGQERAYTLFSYDYGRSGYSDYDGYFLAYSRDGIVWTDGPKDPVIPGHADVGWFTYDQVDRKFRAIVKNFLNIRGYCRRSVFSTESPGGLDWTLPRPAVIPDLEDDAWTEKLKDRRAKGAHTQFYGMPIFRYESLLLGFIQVFRVTDTVNPDNDGEVDVQLVCSRDGHTWKRVGDRRAIVELGTPGTWDAGGVYSGNSLVGDGDEVRLYYTGSNATHGFWDENCKVAIGLASWPRDRFAGLMAGVAGGAIELKPQMVERCLHLNADASRGEILVELLGTDTRIQLKGDSLNHRIEMPASLRGRKMVVGLQLTDAEVFSLWWD